MTLAHLLALLALGVIAGVSTALALLLPLLLWQRLGGGR